MKKRFKNHSSYHFFLTPALILGNSSAFFATPHSDRGSIEPPNKMDTQARSSVGERHLDVVDVVGSIPSAPTK